MKILKIIKEEVSNFDFLNNEKYLENQETYDILSQFEIQKSFIIDSIKNTNKIKITKIIDGNLRGNWEERDIEDANKISLEYFLLIEYLYDSTKSPFKFNLNFYGDNIPVKIEGISDRGDRYTPPTDERWFNYISWDDINVDISDVDGNIVEFTAFNKSSDKIQHLFIKSYLKNFIENETTIDVGD